jgi:hypothetical protein
LRDFSAEITSLTSQLSEKIQLEAAGMINLLLAPFRFTLVSSSLEKKRQRRISMIRTIGIIVILLSLGFTGCATIGAPTITRDRLDYVDAISNSWKRMTLLNIVKLRYGDAPTFLEVSSVITQYAVEGQIELGAIWTDAMIGGDSKNVGGSGKYTDRPTITYNPLMGEKFVRHLLTPIPPAELLSMIQAGWPVEFLLPVCVSAINGIYNRSSARLKAREADPEFEHVIDALSRIQQAGGMGMRVEKKDQKDSMVLLFRQELDEKLAEDVAEVKRLLGLNPEAREFRLSYGSMAKDDLEIAILTRSMIEITAEFAAHVKVPASHISENRASPGVFDRIDSKKEERIRVRIQSALQKPSDAFVAVRYRNYWFYIDDRDFTSKRMFSFLMFLFTLAESGAPEKAPVVTIPTG